MGLGLDSDPSTGACLDALAPTPEWSDEAAEYVRWMNEGGPNTPGIDAVVVASFSACVDVEAAFASEYESFGVSPGAAACIGAGLAADEALMQAVLIARSNLPPEVAALHERCIPPTEMAPLTAPDGPFAP